MSSFSCAGNSRRVTKLVSGSFAVEILLGGVELVFSSADEQKNQNRSDNNDNQDLTLTK